VALNLHLLIADRENLKGLFVCTCTHMIRAKHDGNMEWLLGDLAPHERRPLLLTIDSNCHYNKHARILALKELQWFGLLGPAISLL
jgi:hypothetical protein